MPDMNYLPKEPTRSLVTTFEALMLVLYKLDGPNSAEIKT